MPATDILLSRLQESIRARKGLVGCGVGFSAALSFTYDAASGDGRILLSGTDRHGQHAASTTRGVTALATGDDSVVALLSDGTVRAFGRTESEDAFVAGLSCVRRVGCGKHHIAALLGNGRVLVGGDPPTGTRRIADWPAVTDIACGPHFTAGLTESGTVMLAGSRLLRHAVRTWQSIAGIFADSTEDTLYAITAEGRLLSTSPLPLPAKGWRSLVFVAAAGHRLIAISADGRVHSTVPITHGDQGHPPLSVSCAVSDRHLLLLTRDGTVLAQGENDFGQCNTEGFGILFARFEEFIADRHVRLSEQAAAERHYQLRLVEARRLASRLTAAAHLTAGITAYGRVLTTGGFAASKSWREVISLAAGNAHLVALHKDGHVSADGNSIGGCCEVADWQGICAVAAGRYHTVGLGWDGSVRFCGESAALAPLADWTGIRRIATTDAYALALTFDGHLLAAGDTPFAPAILQGLHLPGASLCLSDTHAALLASDGRVLVLASDGVRELSWPSIRAIAAGHGFTVGLTFGGTLRVAGSPTLARQTADWRHIVSVGCGHGYIAGLTADGHLLTVGSPTPPGITFNDVTRWRDILAFSAGPEHIVALNRDGQILTAGVDTDHRCSAAAHFTLFRDTHQLYAYGQYRRSMDGTDTVATGEDA